MNGFGKLLNISLGQPTRFDEIIQDMIFMKTMILNSKLPPWRWYKILSTWNFQNFIS